MAKKENKAKEQTITIDDKEYKVSDLTQEQVGLVNHVQDLSNKENSMSFNLTQVQGGRNHFMGLLKDSLKNGKEPSN